MSVEDALKLIVSLGVVVPNGRPRRSLRAPTNVHRNIAAYSLSLPFRSKLRSEGLAMRSHYCGQVNRALIGREIRVAGWVHRRRDLAA